MFATIYRSSPKVIISQLGQLSLTTPPRHLPISGGMVFCPLCMACGKFPRPGIELKLPEVEAGRLNLWTTRKCLETFLAVHI